jgi:hypothetical protein
VRPSADATAGVPKVLFVLGFARCGSTILGNVLGEIEGFYSAGEIRFLWERAVEGRRCGCGKPLLGCEVWGGVLRAPGAPAPEDVVRWQEDSVRLRHTWRVLRADRSALASSPLGLYVAELGRVYRLLTETTGADVIVDTSKHPPMAAAASLVAGIQPSFIHLVRDPRAVVFSQLRPKPNPDADEPIELRGPPLRRSALYWTASNAAADAVRRALRPRSAFLRYEDFVERPRTVVEKIARFVGEGNRPSPFADERVVEIGLHHTVSGNPDRFRTGAVEIRSDVRWMHEMTRLEQATVTALTLPLLPRYRYTLRGSHALGSA